ncbi:MAG TPA: hypothetical protein DCP62_05305 [Erysipelotrichaceae bacterium]|nr:MAG: hypothetical protein A2Y19_11065 [Firmicutes bacterium GWE2_51_13]HAM63072.1 hypothetical protein [Erysipelotrichaceae bacterium]HBZ41141.1 hypothetical protein [Erysipelotrichaceae bacterium]
MPRNDGTGPVGLGPMSGRGAGPCNTNRQTANGLGRGLKMGRGRGFCRYVSGDTNEKETLLQQKEWLNQRSTQIENRLNQIDENQKQQG